jgi:uncharacterized membrane protein YfcA
MLDLPTIFDDLPQFAATCGILFLAEFVYVLFGFGAGLISVGLLAALFGELRDVVVLLLLVNLLPELFVVTRLRREVIWRGVAFIGVGMAIGVPTGTWLLQTIDTTVLLAAFGGFLVLAGAALLAAPKKAGIRWPWFAAPITGLVSGVLGGLFGTGGPPLIFYYRLGGVAKATFRGNLMAIFLMVTAVRLPSYALGGLITAPRLVSALAVLPAVLLGAYLGHRIQLNMPESAFQRLVAISLVPMGVLLLVRGWVQG